MELRHLLAHTSGVSGLDQPAAVEDLYDWNTSTARMAAQAPWWEPGTASGYHALNYGHLLGEVLRRVTGRSLKTFAYMMNSMAPGIVGSTRAEAYARALYAALNVPLPEVITV